MGILTKLLDRTFSPISKALNADIGIRGAEPRKGNFQWMAGLPSKKVMKPVVVNALTLKQLSNTDPITWAIKATRKAQITGTEWDIVRDTEAVELEIDRWYQIILNNLNPWGYTEDFHPMLLNKDVHLKATEDIKKILQSPFALKKDIKEQLKWYFESLKRKINQDADAHALTVKRLFERPNSSETPTFRSFLEILLEDLLTFDSGVIVKNRNALGELAEMYLIPGQDVKIYRNPDRTVPKAPEPAYVWEDNGVLRAEYTRDEIIYMMANPQQNGYGMSPLEVAAYIITASLYADEYNIDFFKHSNVPPAVFNMGKNITSEQRVAFQNQWDNEVAGKGLHRMMFLSGCDTPEYIPIRNMSSRDMQMMEYLKWTVSIKCACYQISPQDIGFVMDFHRSTAETQKELTKARGIKNLLALLETYFNTEIVKKEFPFRDVKFQWQGIDLTDDKVQCDIDIADINNGVISRNDRRKRLGMPAVEGGDTILVNVGSQFVPIAELMPPEEEQATEQPIEGEQPAQEQPAQDKEAFPTKKQPTGQPTQLQPAKEEKPVEPKQPVDESIKEKAVNIKLASNNSLEKLEKVMDTLKKQGLGDNDINITLGE